MLIKTEGDVVRCNGECYAFAPFAISVGKNCGEMECLSSHLFSLYNSVCPRDVVAVVEMLLGPIHTGPKS